MMRQTEIQSSDMTLDKLYCGLENVSHRKDSLATANTVHNLIADKKSK